MVIQRKSVPIQTKSAVDNRAPVLTGMVLPVLQGEIAEAIRELQEGRLVRAALERLCTTRPELRGEIQAEMQRVIAEQQAAQAAQAAPRKTKRR